MPKTQHDSGEAKPEQVVRNWPYSSGKRREADASFAVA